MARPKRPDHHRQRGGDVVEGGVGAQARKILPVVGHRRRVRHQNLAEPVGALVRGEAGQARVRHQGQRGERQDGEGRDDGVEGNELHLGGGDLFAEVFRCSPDHQTGDEQADERDEHEAVESRPQPAEDHLAEEHVHHGHHAADRRVAVVHRVVGARGSVGGRHRRQRRAADPEAHLLALHVAAGLQGARRVAPRRGRPACAPRCSATWQTRRPAANSTSITESSTQP